MPTLKIIVTDTSPLITLAAADSLDYLLYPDVPVLIPDGVFYEATREQSKLGAVKIRDWVNACAPRVSIVATAVTGAALASGQMIKGLGELAAVEAIQESKLDANDRALLLLEDAGAVRLLVSTDAIPLSTRDYLTVLEENGRIQSADAVYQRAQAAGRTPAALDLLAGLSSEEREAFAAAIATARPIGDILAEIKERAQ